MTTRAILITQRYNQLTDELKTIIDAELFPDLENIELSDLLTYITLTFFSIEERVDFEKKLKYLITCNNLQNKILDVIFKF
jgi:hypothetical protein